MNPIQIFAKLIMIVFWPFGFVIGGIARGIHVGFWYGYTRKSDATEALIRVGLNNRLRGSGLALKEDIDHVEIHL